jgi:DNA-binding GntR family transcriptional regulator
MPADLVRLETAPDLVDQAYRALLAAISSGALAPGQRFTQEDLAARLAVSRQPVLQALRLLKKDGLVEDAPGRGLRVAAERRVALAPALLRDGRRAAKGNDVHTMLEADIHFHRALYAASGNPFIERSAEAHWAHIRRAMGAVLQNSRARRPVWDEHEAIADAVSRGDPDTAALAAGAHAHSASEHLARQLDTTRQGDTA